MDLDQWDFGPRPPMNIHSIYMGSDGILWAADQGSNKLTRLRRRGTLPLFMGNVQLRARAVEWGVHGFATDKEGNLYTAEVRTDRVQKYTSQGRESGVPRGQTLAGGVVAASERYNGAKSRDLLQYFDRIAKSIHGIV